MGIGNETPGYALDVTGDINLSGRIRVNGNGGTANQVLKVDGTGTGIEWGPSVASSLSIPATNAGEVLYYNGSTWVPLAVPGAASDAAASWALTLPNAGQGAPQWIESTSLIVSGDDLGDHTATEDIKLNGYDITGTGNITIVGRVNSNGILETSDGRFKKDVEVISDALSTVQNLRGVTYDWKAEEFPDRGFNAQREMGVIAQEVELLVPEVVNTDENGFKSVQYGHLVPLLIEAIKEQQKIIDGQQVELTSLKAMQDEMETLKASIELLSEHIKTAAK